MSPWHVKATYQEFDSKGKLSGSGSYEEFRVSDKSYKRTYTSPTFTQTDYATEGDFIEPEIRIGRDARKHRYGFI